MKIYYILLFHLLLDIIKATNITIRYLNNTISNDNYKIFGTELEINKTGKYFIKGNSNKASIVINSSNIAINFINSSLLNFEKPIILINENLYNITISLENTIITSLKNEILRVKNGTEFELTGEISTLKGKEIIYFEGNNKLKLGLKKKEYNIKNKAYLYYLNEINSNNNKLSFADINYMENVCMIDELSNLSFNKCKFEISELVNIMNENNENNENNNIDKNYNKKNKKRISINKNNRNKSKKIDEQDKILIEDYKNKYNISMYKNVVKEKVIISNEIKNYFLLKKNNNILTNNTLIILIKYSSKNINIIVEVIYSLLFQSANISSYQCFIILNKKDFLNGNDDFPVDLQTLIENKWVKIIWDKNIFTFIKLYQENDIMIVEDNILRNFDYIEMFQNDHKIYSNDVLCGIFSYNFDSEMKLNKLNGYKIWNGLEINVVPNMIFQTSMPLYGIGGVYYPKHTFSDERFFNEMLYKQISSSSYEMWLYAFNIIEDKILRQTSKIYDFSLNILDKNKCLTIESLNIGNETLSSINERIIEYIPEYKTKSIERQKKLIVSITSYKQRFKKLHLVLESIFNNSLKPYKVILTIYKGDYEFLTEEIMSMVNEKRLELIETEIDFKPHKKYFDVMKKYKDYAIITIDDDVIYTSDLIESMYKSYMKYPNCVHGRVVHKYQMIRGSNEIAPYRKWKKRYINEINPSYDLLAVGIGGILYPPDILNISDFNINEIFKCITADDIYLKYLEIKKNIKTVWVPYKTFYWENQLKDDEIQKYALYKNNMKGLNLNDKCIKIFNIVP